MKSTIARITGAAALAIALLPLATTATAASLTPAQAYCAASAKLPPTIPTFTPAVTAAQVHRIFVTAMRAVTTAHQMYKLGNNGSVAVSAQMTSLARGLMSAAGGDARAAFNVYELYVNHQNVTKRTMNSIIVTSARFALTQVPKYTAALAALRPQASAWCAAATSSTTTSPPSTTTAPPAPAPLAVIANGAGISLNAVTVRWSTSGITGVTKVSLFTFQGAGCTAPAHVAATTYSAANNTTSGYVTSTGPNYYAPAGPFSGYIVVASTSGTLQSGCISLGRS